MKKDTVIVPAAMLEELKSLQHLSSKTNRATPLGHEFRRAGDMLAELAVNAMAEYGVTVTGLSRQMGLSDHTMSYFLQRRRAIQPTPGVERNLKMYKNQSGAGSRIAVCKRGHDQSGDTRNSFGQCKPCMGVRKRAAYQEAKNAA